MRVAFDIGGTFTDVIALEEGNTLRAGKVLSLIDRLGEDITGFADETGSDDNIDRFVHATTICSNAVIEGQAAKVGLITTEGFRDTLELRCQRGPSGSVRGWSPPKPMVPRDRCMEVTERVLADGSVDTPLDPGSVDAAIRALVGMGVDAIAVCLVHAYANTDHERRIEERIRALYPSLTYCLSSDVLLEVREYDRTSTVVVNTALMPVVNAYLDKLSTHLDPRSPHLQIMQSSGGIMASKVARERPMLMIESGPAAGVLAAGRLASEMGLDEVLSFDMGGTTAKACYIANGRPSERPAGQIATAATVGGSSSHDGHTVRVPTVDLVEVGAGGGSIAWIDKGALAVGPRSAGADPGPICYDRGGTQPTVTDANIVLGKINPVAIADGQLKVDRPAALAAIERLGAQLGLEAMHAAHGITQIANAVMMRALRAVSTERGYDPRRCAMIAFGGAGSLHAAALAESMGIRKIVIPPYAGVLSAMGLLMAEHRIDYVRSLVTPIDEVEPDAIAAAFVAMESDARDDYHGLGIDPATIRFERQADLRYNYQIDDMALPVPDVPPRRLPGALRQAFMDLHEREFGFVGDGTITLVNLRLRALTPASDISFAALADSQQAEPRKSEKTFRNVYYGPELGLLSTPVIARSDIRNGMVGPLIVEEADTTISVPPEWTVTRHDNGAVLLERP